MSHLNEPERLFEKAIEDEWHAIRITLGKEAPPTELLRRIMRAQQVILESLYYLRTGQVLKP